MNCYEAINLIREIIATPGYTLVQVQIDDTREGIEGLKVTYRDAFGSGSITQTLADGAEWEHFRTWTTRGARRTS